MHNIVAVVVTYNPSVTEFKEQLDAIVGYGMSVVVIDNASANFTELAARLREFDSTSVTVHQNSENVGLAEGQNLGITEARRRGASHVIFFDQDSVPQPGFMQALISAEEDLTGRGEKVSAVGPATYDPTTSEYYPITRYFGPFIRRNYPQGNTVVEATFLMSSGSLVRMQVLDEVGPMRSELFIDYIDVEWCLRAKNLGYRCFVASAARMSHRIGDARVRMFGRTISAHSPLRRYYLIRNSFLMLRLSYVPVSYKLREVALNVLRVSAHFYLSKDRGNYFRLLRRAIADGVAGRYGKL